MKLHLRGRQKVLDFFNRNFIKIVGIPFSILTLAFTIYALLCTVYSDVIVQNGNDCWDLPMECLTEKEIETTFTELSGKDKQDKSLYVFVLDISGSIKKNQMEEAAYIKYEKAIQAVNNKFGGNILRLKDIGAVDIYDIAKARLFELLLALLEKNKKECCSEFAVWTLGDKGTKIFPDDSKITVDSRSIKEAIKKINRPMGKPSRYTNFVSLFYRFTNVYDEELSKKNWGEYENPTFFLTILSDLIHDVDNKRRKEIEGNWDDLKEKIQEICDSKIMSNMIVFSEKEPDMQREIFSLFKKNLDWYRLNKYLLGEEKNNTFFYTVRSTKKNIVFYYENPNFISNSKFTLIFKSKNTINIDIPLQENDPQQISILCERIGAKGDPNEDNKKRIISGGSEYVTNLQKNEKIRLTFNGRLPSALSSPILRISLANEGRTFLVPIYFIKRLPDWASEMFIILKKIIFGLIIFTLVGVILFGSFNLNHFVKKKKMEKPQENGIEGGPSPDQDSTDEGDETPSLGPGPHGKKENEETHEPETDAGASQATPETELVNINTAPANELKKSLGISAKLVKILKNNRPFNNPDDLIVVLGKKVFNKIKDQICV